MGGVVSGRAFPPGAHAVCAQQSPRPPASRSPGRPRSLSRRGCGGSQHRAGRAALSQLGALWPFRAAPEPHRGAAEWSRACFETRGSSCGSSRGGRPPLGGGRSTVRVRAGTQATPGRGGRGRGSRGGAGVPLLTPAFIWGLPGSLPALGPSSSTWQRCPLWSRTARSQQGRGPGRAGTSGPTHPVVAPRAVSDSPGSTKSNAAISTPRRLPLVSFAPFEEAESRGDSPCKPEGGDTADPAQRPLSARGAASAGRAPHCTRSASPTVNSPPGCEEEGRGLTSRRGRVGRSGKWDLRLPRGSADAREK